MLKWFLIGFGIRTILALVVFFLALMLGFETFLLYFADVPTTMLLELAEMVLPQSIQMALVSGHPFYLPMNFIAGLLWGGIFMLIPLAGKMGLRLWHITRP